ncbi:MAG: CHAT domain-containing protein [Phormidesmis sp.]
MNKLIRRWIKRRAILVVLGLLLSLCFTVSLPRVEAQETAQEAPLVWVETGQDYYQSGQFSAAADLLAKAVQAYEMAGERLSQAQTLRLWALPLQAMDQWAQAQTALEQSLALLEALPKDHIKLKAQVLNAQGKGQLATGQTTLALESWRLAEKDYAAAKDLEGVLGSQLNQTTALQTLGFYRQARQQLESIESQIADSPTSILKVKALLSLGNTMRLQGEIERSHHLLQTSLTLTQQLSTSANPPNLSEIYSELYLALANTQRVLHNRYTPNNEANNSETEKTYLQTAIAYYEQAATVAPSSRLQLQAQLSLLNLIVEAAKTDASYLQSAETLTTALSAALPRLLPSRPAIYAQINFVQSLMDLALLPSERFSLPDSEAIINTAIQQSQDLQDNRAYTYALGTLGAWYEQQQDWQRAIARTRAAQSIAQSLSAPDITYQWQWQLGRLLKQTGNVSEAIAQYTAAVETLGKLRSELVTLNSDIRFEFRASVEPVYRQLVDLLLRDAEPTPAQLIQAREVIESLQLAELDNFFRDACASPKAINIDNLDPQAAILYPIVLKDRLEIILKLPGESNLLHYAQPNVSAMQVNQTVNQLLTQLNRRSSNPQALKETSQQLYNWLIKPFEAALETTLEREISPFKTLTFVLDGSLRNVPMAALYDGERYLVERYAIATTPGLDLLEPRPFPRQTLRALLAGAEDAPSFQTANLGPLINVSRELNGIKHILPKSRLLENESFLKETLYEQINQVPFNVVHLATHGQFSADPDQTFVLDWRSRIPAKDIDDLLFLLDPQRAVENPIELLVLSACETAAGDNRAALGLAGIAIRAGARSTVATLWNINDASTAEFMTRFYQQLSRPDLNKAEALRNAQLAFLQDYEGTDYRRPYHWAAFTLIGNWL